MYAAPCDRAEIDGKDRSAPFKVYLSGEVSSISVPAPSCGSMLKVQPYHVDSAVSKVPDRATCVTAEETMPIRAVLYSTVPREIER